MTYPMQVTLHTLSNIRPQQPYNLVYYPCFGNKETEPSDVKIKFTQFKESGLIPRSMCLQSSCFFHYPTFNTVINWYKLSYGTKCEKLHETKSVFSKSWVSDGLFHKPLPCDSIISPASCPSRVHQKPLKCCFTYMTVRRTSSQREPVFLSSHRGHFDSVAAWDRPGLVSYGRFQDVCNP